MCKHPYLCDFPDMRLMVDLKYRSAVNASTSLPGGNSEWEPPESIPNSEVKLLSADDSVGPPHVKVGHCQAYIRNPREAIRGGFLFVAEVGSGLVVGRSRSNALN